MTLESRDAEFLSRALTLAQRGEGLVSPGALVGAVVAKDGRVVGEGFYQYDLKKHAEVVAIEKAGQAAKGATLYLNLEPCSHFGRTPPCADFVIRSGIRHVVCSMRDPNPRVAGKGFRRLKSAGIEVQVGGLSSEAATLNEAFVKFIATQTPFVILKAAMTLDGKIAVARQKRGSTTWITSLPSRERVHRIRHASDALLVGVNTVLMDDPQLTDRSELPRRRPMLRIVLDPHLRTPLRAKLLSTVSDDVLLLCAKDHSPSKRRSIERRGAWVEECLSHDHVKSWRRILRLLARREIQSLLIEGGGSTNWSAIRCGVVDKFYFFIAPRILGGSEHVPVVGGRGFSTLKQAASLSDLTVEQIGEDVLLTGYAKKFHP